METFILIIGVVIILVSLFGMFEDKIYQIQRYYSWRKFFKNHPKYNDNWKKHFKEFINTDNGL